jgi:formate dehydrogenase iron-sulfur subunit
VSAIQPTLQSLEASRAAGPVVTGFLTDATLCIGCKACEVACKEWNGVPEDGLRFSGLSYDNTESLGASTWRHVLFVEQRGRALGPQVTGGSDPFRWFFLSDVCKHCKRAGCLEVCPTGAIVRTEFGSVLVQADVCNGCGYCVVGCPFGVVGRRVGDGRAFKCTFCYDRQLAGRIPACAQACPTDSILFGPLEELRQRAEARVEALRARGYGDAGLYDAEGTAVGGVHALFVTLGPAEDVGLPPRPVFPGDLLGPAWTSALASALAIAAAVAGVFAF